MGLCSSITLRGCLQPSWVHELCSVFVVLYLAVLVVAVDWRLRESLAYMLDGAAQASAFVVISPLVEHDEFVLVFVLVRVVVILALVQAVVLASAG